MFEIPAAPNPEPRVQRFNPVEAASNAFNKVKERIPSPNKIALAIAGGLEVMTIACSPGNLDANYIPPTPIAGPRVPGAEVAGAAATGQMPSVIEEAQVVKAEVRESLRPEERTSLKHEVETVISTVKKFLKPDFLDASKINLDSMADNLTKNDPSLINWRKHRNLIQRPDGGHELSTTLPESTISARIIRDSANQVELESVNFLTDPEVSRVLPDLDNSHKNFGNLTVPGLMEIPANLPRGLILPEGRKPNNPLNYNWELPLVLNTDGKLDMDLFMRTMPDAPYRTNDGKNYRVSIGAADNGVTRVEVSQSSK